MNSILPSTEERARFQALVRAHYRAVYAFAYSRLGRADAAEDATQEAFLRAYRSLARCRGDSAFGGWVLGIAANCVHEEVRRRRRAARPIPPPEAAEEPPERSEELGAAIAELGDRPRMVLTLKYFEGLSCQEIAGRLGMSVSNVKVTLHRAYRFLRGRMSDAMR